MKKKIQRAFWGVNLGSGIGLYEAEGLDRYSTQEELAAYRAKDERSNWQALNLEDLNRCNCSLSYFDPEGMRFHLPAYLIADLEGIYRFDLVFTLIQSDHLEEKFSLLNPDQRAAIRSYLELVQSDPDYKFEKDEIRQALDNFWSR
ncbi:DUF6714 family protein [Leptospira sp. WS92.C1]